VNPVRLAELPLKKGTVNEITKLEALTVLQAESQNLVSGARRPDISNDLRVVICLLIHQNGVAFEIRL
jgi:hypothetical protein